MHKEQEIKKETEELNENQEKSKNNQRNIEDGKIKREESQNSERYFQCETPGKNQLNIPEKGLVQDVEVENGVNAEDSHKANKKHIRLSKKENLINKTNKCAECQKIQPKANFQQCEICHNFICLSCVKSFNSLNIKEVEGTNFTCKNCFEECNKSFEKPSKNEIMKFDRGDEKSANLNKPEENLNHYEKSFSPQISNHDISEIVNLKTDNSKKILDMIKNVDHKEQNERHSFKTCILCMESVDYNDLLKFKTLHEFVYFLKSLFESNDPNNYLELSNQNTLKNKEIFIKYLKNFEKHYTSGYVFKSVNYVCFPCFKDIFMKENGYNQLFNSLHMNNSTLGNNMKVENKPAVINRNSGETKQKQTPNQINSNVAPQIQSNSNNLSSTKIKLNNPNIGEDHNKNNKHVDIERTPLSIIISKDILKNYPFREKREEKSQNSDKIIEILKNNLVGPPNSNGLNVNSFTNLNNLNNFQKNNPQTQNNFNSNPSLGGGNLFNLKDLPNLSNQMTPQQQQQIFQNLLLSQGNNVLNNNINPMTNPFDFAKGLNINNLTTSGLMQNIGPNLTNNMTKINELLNKFNNEGIADVKENISTVTNNETDNRKEIGGNFYGILEELKNQVSSMQYYSMIQKVFINYIFKNVENFIEQVAPKNVPKPNLNELFNDFQNNFNNNMNSGNMNQMLLGQIQNQTPIQNMQEGNNLLQNFMSNFGKTNNQFLQPNNPKNNNEQNENKNIFEQMSQNKNSFENISNQLKKNQEIQNENKNENVKKNLNNDQINQNKIQQQEQKKQIEMNKPQPNQQINEINQKTNQLLDQMNVQNKGNVNNIFNLINNGTNPSINKPAPQQAFNNNSNDMNNPQNINHILQNINITNPQMMNSSNNMQNQYSMNNLLNSNPQILDQKAQMMEMLRTNPQLSLLLNQQQNVNPFFGMNPIVNNQFDKSKLLGMNHQQNNQMNPMMLNMMNQMGQLGQLGQLGQMAPPGQNQMNPLLSMMMGQNQINQPQPLMNQNQMNHPQPFMNQNPLNSIGFNNNDQLQKIMTNNPNKLNSNNEQKPPEQNNQFSDILNALRGNPNMNLGALQGVDQNNLMSILNQFVSNPPNGNNK